MERKRTKGYVYIETPLGCGCAYMGDYVDLVAIFEEISEAYICVEALNNACTSEGCNYFATTEKVAYDYNYPGKPGNQ